MGLLPSQAQREESFLHILACSLYFSQNAQIQLYP